MGSPWCAPLSNLKYFVVLASFMMYDSWLFNSFYPFNECHIHLMNVMSYLRIHISLRLKLKTDD